MKKTASSPTKRVHTDEQMHTKSVADKNEENCRLNLQDEPIQIYLRIRPSEHLRSCKLVQNTVKLDGNTFTFHKIITSSSQDQIHELIKPILNDTLAGYNSTIFTYGQTATGKTYTVTGTERDPGIVPKILEWTQKDAVSMSVLEIYNEQLRDLLVEQSEDIAEQYENNSNLSLNGGTNFNSSFLSNSNGNFNGNSNGKSLTIRETVKSGIQVNNLKRVELKSYEESVKNYKTALTRRKKDQTQRNKESSRSHCILILWFKSKNGSQSESRMNVVDLAGSEKIGENAYDQRNENCQGTFTEDAQSSDDLLMNFSSFHQKTKKDVKGKNLETGNINKSLLTLREVIKKLVSQNDHIPYRDSKLTFLLKDSLGGSSKLMVIGTVDFKHKTESLNTMVFLDMIKMMENKPVPVLFEESSPEVGKKFVDVQKIEKKPNKKNKLAMEKLEKMKNEVKELEKQLEEVKLEIYAKVTKDETEKYEKLDKQLEKLFEERISEL